MSTNPKKILVITGNEICHNFFVNFLTRHCPAYSFDVLKHYSGKNDLEYFYSIYSVGIQTKEEKADIVRFIANRNVNFALREDFEFLKSPQQAAVAMNMGDFNRILDEMISKTSYDYVLCYGAPLIKNEKLLSRSGIAFNIHIGLARYYRGGSTNIFALSQGEYDKVGLTCHELKAKIDSGDVLFEVADVDYRGIRTIDDLNYYLLKAALNKLVGIINSGSTKVYPVPQGKMFYHKDFQGQMVLAAERALLRRSDAC